MELDNVTLEERERIVGKLRVVAIAVAELWDICSQIEETYELEIKFEVDWVEVLGGLCDSPAVDAALDFRELWDLFAGFSTITLI